jgi:hypothetical protein
MKLTRVSVMKPDTFMRNYCGNKNPKSKENLFLLRGTKRREDIGKDPSGESKKGTFDRGWTDNM